MSWALRHREVFPVDLNRAPREQLLRVPGLGVRSVDRLLALRRHRKVRLDDLPHLKAAMTRVAPFVITDERALPATRVLDSARLSGSVRAEQLDLFEVRVSARSGEV